MNKANLQMMMMMMMMVVVVVVVTMMTRQRTVNKKGNTILYLTFSVPLKELRLLTKLEYGPAACFFCKRDKLLLYIKQQRGKTFI
jgi:hypothetical protein